MVAFGVVKKLVFIIKMCVAILAVEMPRMLHVMLLQTVRRVEDLHKTSTSNLFEKFQT